MGVSGGARLNRATWNQAVLILGPVKSYFICKLICTPDNCLSVVTDIFNIQMAILANYAGQYLHIYREL